MTKSFDTISLIIIVLVVVVAAIYRRFRPATPKLSDASSPNSAIRDTLFGDRPLETWCGDGVSLPWSLFAAAKRHLDAGERDDAIASLKEVLALPGLESRHYVQAWHFLRPLGQNPPPEEKLRVLGVVVEVPVSSGLDLVAAYPDHSARYYNFSGAGVAWEHPDTSLDGHIDRLLSNGQSIAQQIGPWEGARPGPPPKNQVRISMLTPGGLCFGQGPFNAMAADPRGGPVIKAATDLMLALMAKSKQAKE